MPVTWHMFVKKSFEVVLAGVSWWPWVFCGQAVKTLTRACSFACTSEIKHDQPLSSSKLNHHKPLPPAHSTQKTSLNTNKHTANTPNKRWTLLPLGNPEPTRTTSKPKRCLAFLVGQGLFSFRSQCHSGHHFWWRLRSKAIGSQTCWWPNHPTAHTQWA